MIATRTPLSVEYARPDDAPAIRRLLSRPMAGRAAFALRRDPDHHFAAGIEGDRHTEIVVRDLRCNRVVACAARSVRDVWIDGRIQRVGYLSALRTEAGRSLSRRAAKAGFEILAADRRDDEADFDITSIMAHNMPARRLLERGLPDWPTYTPLGKLSTLVLRVPRRTSKAALDFRAAPRDLTAILDALRADARLWQCRPAWTAEDLASPQRSRGLDASDFYVTRSSSGIGACCAVWDQRSFKQIVVDGYAGWLRRLRSAANVTAALLGAPTLPRPGAALELGYVSHLMVRPDRPRDLETLLAAALNGARRRGLTHLALGMPNDNPLRTWLQQRYHPWVAESIVYAVHRGAPPVFADLPVWPEVATL